MNAIAQFPRRRVASKEGPDPADIHIGGRIRMLRTIRGKSQTDLAAAIVISHQQLQKYETGDSRISASMLHRIATVLDLPISAFIDSVDFEINATSILSDEITLREMLAMISAYRAIPTAELRSRLYRFAEALADYGIPKGVANAAE
ncbi:MAG TPA: helix-turn-helix transcriptional regulator [Azospirillaceae bacterium]|nr:helix-turn-helix transcriptional regulator [Azospirillaceae bacterium]